MTVFKNYLKVAKTFFGIVATYTVIFIAIAVFTSTSGSSNTDAFEATEVKIALINHDSNSAFVENFEQYISEKAELVDIEEDEESLKDALFFRKVDYIMIVPKGYTEDFIAGKDIKIETMTVADSTGAIYSKQLMNTYLNTANIYLKADISEEVLADKVKEDLDQEVKVNMLSADSSSQVSSAKNFYNFANYTLLSLIMITITLVMIAFNEDKIKRRNLISPVPYKSVNRQLLLGNIVVAIIIWAVYVIASIVLYPDAMMSTHGILYVANSGVFVLFILAFSFLLASLSNNREVVNGIANIVGLGTSFISGAFVPQELLGSFVLTIAKFTPSYWFVKNNEDIATLTKFDMNSLQPVFMNMAIIFGFAVLMYILIQVASKLKLKK